MTNDAKRGRPGKPQWSYLYTLRKQKGLTQEQLAERTGLWQNQIGEFERGIRPPSPKQLSAIADALETPDDELAKESQLFFANI